MDDVVSCLREILGKRTEPEEEEEKDDDALDTDNEQEKKDALIEQIRKKFESKNYDVDFIIKQKGKNGFTLENIKMYFDYVFEKVSEQRRGGLTLFRTSTKTHGKKRTEKDIICSSSRSLPLFAESTPILRSS